MSLELSEHYDKIYTYCYFKVRNKEAAEDLTQETFLKYFKTTQYLEKGKKLAFLYTVARNCCNDYFRSRHCEEHLDKVEEFCDEGIEDLSTTLAVREAVAKLTEEEQEIVFLRYTNGLTLGEIAQYVGLSRFALYRKISAIERCLKEHLRKEDFYE